MDKQISIKDVTDLDLLANILAQQNYARDLLKEQNKVVGIINQLTVEAELRLKNQAEKRELNNVKNEIDEKSSNPSTVTSGNGVLEGTEA